MATIFDDLLDVREEAKEKKQSLFEKAARLVLPQGVEERFFGPVKAPTQKTLQGTIFDDLVITKEEVIEKPSPTPLPPFVGQPPEQLFTPVPQEKPRTLTEKARKSFMAGIGDVFAIGGSAMQWLGAKNIGQSSIDYGEQIRKENFISLTEEQFTWKRLVDPEFYATTVSRSLPFSLSLIPAAIVGAYAGVGTAVAFTVGTFGRVILGAVGATLLTRPLESALEAGGVYGELLEQGKSEEEADKAADTTFKKNLALGGLDVAQLVIAFTPLKYLGISGKNVILRRLIATGGKGIAVGIQEAGEERYQEVIQKMAVGEEVSFFDFEDPQLNEATAVGGIFGVGLGGAGSVFTTLTARIKREMPPEMLQLTERIESEEIAKGAAPQQAELTALDTIAETPEGKKHIEQVMENLKRITQRLEPLPERQIKPAEVSAQFFERILRGKERFRVSKKAADLLKEQLVREEEKGRIVRLENQIDQIIAAIQAKPEPQRTAAEKDLVQKSEVVKTAARETAEEVKPEEVPGITEDLGTDPIFIKEAKDLSNEDLKAIDRRLSKVGVDIDRARLTPPQALDALQRYVEKGMTLPDSLKVPSAVVTEETKETEEITKPTPALDLKVGDRVEVFDESGKSKITGEVRKIEEDSVIVKDDLSGLPIKFGLNFEFRKTGEEVEAPIQKPKEPSLKDMSDEDLQKLKESTSKKLESEKAQTDEEFEETQYNLLDNVYVELEKRGLIEIPEDYEIEIIEPQNDKEFKEGFEAQGLGKTKYDNNTRTFHPTETRATVPSPETRARVSALKQPLNQLGYVLNLIKRDEQVPEDLRPVIELWNEEGKRNFGESSIEDLGEGKYKILFSEELISEEALEEFYPSEEYAEIEDYHKLQEDSGINTGDFAENDVVKFTDETGQRFARLVDIFDDAKAIVETSTGQVEVDFYSLTKPTKLTKAQQKISEGIFPEEKIEGSFEITPEFAKKANVIVPKAKTFKKAPPKNIKGKIFDIVSFATDKRAALPILGKIAISGKRILATDLETFISYEADKEIGSTVLPLDAVKGMTAEDIQIKGKEIEIRGFKIIGEDIKEYPNFPELTSPARAQFSSENVKMMLNRLIASTSTSQTRPEIASVFIKAEKGKITFVSTDSFRLNQLSVQANVSKPFKAMFPIEPAKKLLRVINAVKPEQIEILFSEKEQMVQFKFDNFNVTAKARDGEYPNYEDVLAEIGKPKNQISVSTEALFNALRRIPDTTFNDVLFELKAKEKKLRLFKKEKDNVYEQELDIEIAEPKLTTQEDLFLVMAIKDGGGENASAYNKKFLEAYLKTVGTEQTSLANITEEKPLVVREQKGSATNENLVRESTEEYGKESLEQIKKAPVYRTSTVAIVLKRIGRLYTDDLQIRHANDVADIFSELKTETREKVFVLNLNKNNRIINAALVSIGSIDASLVSPAEIVKQSIVSGAKKVFFIHNHPSGDATPSEEDISMMQKLKGALAGSGIELLGGIVINHTEYGFVDKDINPTTVKYTPRVRKGKAVSITELEQIFSETEEILSGKEQITRPLDVAKFFSESINPQVKTVSLLHLNTRNNLKGYDVIGYSLDNVDMLTKAMAETIAFRNTAKLVIATNIPLDTAYDQEAIDELYRFGKLLEVPLIDAVYVNVKEGTFTSYLMEEGFSEKRSGVSDNIENYGDFTREEKTVLKAIMEGRPVPVELFSAVKSLREKGVIQDTKKPERVRAERPVVERKPYRPLKEGEKISQNGVTFARSQKSEKRPYAVIYITSPGKRVTRTYETEDEARARFDIMVEIRSRARARAGELPEEMQATKEQKQQAHIIANTKKITPLQYRRLANAYTGVDSMNKMTPDQAVQFIDALTAIKPKFGGKISIPLSKAVVTQEEAEQKFANIRAGWLIDIFRTPANVFRKIGVGRQADPIFTGLTLRNDFVAKWFGQFKRWQKRLGIRGGIFVLTDKSKVKEQSRRMFRAINNPEADIELSEQEALIVGHARMLANDVADEVDKARAEIGLDPMARKENYITNLLTEESHFLLQQTKQAPNELYALMDIRMPPGVFDKLLLERKGGLPIKEDFWQAIKVMTRVHARYIFLNPPIHRFERFMRFYGDKVPVLSRVYIRGRLSRFLGRPNLTEKFLRGLDEAITDMISRVPGLRRNVEVELQNGITEVFEVPRIILRPTQKVFRLLKSIRYVYDLAFSVSFYTINLTQFWLNTVPKLRGNFVEIYQSAFQGYAQMMLDFFRPSKWSYWKERGVLTEIDNVLDEELGTRGSFNVLNLFAKLSEFNNRVATVLAAEKNMQILMKKGKYNTLYKELNERFGDEAKEYANNLSDITQFRYGIEQKPVFFDNPVLDLYYQYNTFALKQAEFTVDMAQKLEAKGILPDFREAVKKGKTKEFVADLTQGQRGEFIRFIINAYILSLLLSWSYIWEAIFKGIVPNQIEGAWKVIKGLWTGDRKLRGQGFKQVLMPPAADLLVKVVDYGIAATIKNAKAIRQLDLIAIVLKGEGELRTIEGKKKEEITGKVALERLFKSNKEETALRNREGWGLYLDLSRRYDDTRERSIELIKNDRKKEARDLARKHNKRTKAELKKLEDMELTDLRLQERIKEARKSKIVDPADFDRWVKDARI